MQDMAMKEKPVVALIDLRPDEKILQEMILKQIGPKLSDPAAAAELQSGDPNVMFKLMKGIFKDKDSVRKAYPDAAEDQLDELMAELNNDDAMRNTLANGMRTARETAMDKQVADVVKLMMIAPKYRTLFVADLAWRVLPALIAGQFQFKVDGEGNLVAFISWAWVSDEVQERSRNAGLFRLKEDEWQSGENLVIMDVISPQGHEVALAKEMADHLRKLKTEKSRA